LTTGWPGRRAGRTTHPTSCRCAMRVTAEKPVKRTMALAERRRVNEMVMPRIHPLSLSLVCKHCSTTFIVQKAKGGNVPGYCSETCRRASKLKRDQLSHPRKGKTEQPCVQCGSLMLTDKNRRFCTRNCSWRHNRKVDPSRGKPCKACGLAITRPVGRGTDRLYCSAKCRPKRAAGHGYIAAFRPDHPLAQRTGWQYEHRIVLYDMIGAGEHPCHWCGKALSWKINYNAADNRGLGVDHLDRDRTNNTVANLVPSCRSCNNARRVRDYGASRKTVAVDGGFGRTPGGG
jgi:hypothetical protein